MSRRGAKSSRAAHPVDEPILLLGLDHGQPMRAQVRHRLKHAEAGLRAVDLRALSGLHGVSGGQYPQPSPERINGSNGACAREQGGRAGSAHRCGRSRRSSARRLAPGWWAATHE